MRVATILLTCFLMSTVGWAQAPDGTTTAAGVVCSKESGKALDLCNQYCRALACPLADDGDRDTDARGSSRECDKVARKFRSLTGRDVPCRDIACPCADPSSWPDPAAGLQWQNFALGAFSPEDTTCSDDSAGTRLVEAVPDFAPAFAGVDTALGECQVSSGDAARPTLTLRISTGEARACQRLLRRAQGSPCR